MPVSRTPSPVLPIAVPVNEVSRAEAVVVSVEPVGVAPEESVLGNLDRGLSLCYVMGIGSCCLVMCFGISYVIAHSLMDFKENKS